MDLELRKDIASVVTLWNVNGFKVASVESAERVNCVAMSTAMEGINVNVVVGGMETGSIIIWSGWDMSPVRKVNDSSSPILSLVISPDSSYFLSGNQKGELIAWGKKPGEKDKKGVISTAKFNPPVNVISVQSK